MELGGAFTASVKFSLLKQNEPRFWQHVDEFRGRAEPSPGTEHLLGTLPGSSIWARDGQRAAQSGC